MDYLTHWPNRIIGVGGEGGGGRGEFFTCNYVYRVYLCMNILMIFITVSAGGLVSGDVNEYALVLNFSSGGDKQNCVRCWRGSEVFTAACFFLYPASLW